MRRIGLLGRVALTLSVAFILCSLTVPTAHAAAPTITSFAPSSGPVGTTVVINGAGFQDTSAATSVAFNAVAATTFTVDSDVQVTATVPDGATSGPISVADAEGTATSTSSFTVTAAPTITDFSPARGIAGTNITISGTGFTETTAVQFNGKDAMSFTVFSDAELTARVPSGAGSGPITVTSASGTATSDASFGFLRDKHSTNVALVLSGHLLATGEVRIPDGERVCRADRKVIVERRESGRWKTVRSRDTRADGSYRVSLPDQEGTYRARVKLLRLVDDICTADASPSKSHEHASGDGGGGGGEDGGGGNCHPSYPDVCIPPPPPDLDCGDIPYTNFRVTGTDPHGFDGDNDGIGCET